MTAAGERVRMREQIARTHALLIALETTLDMNVPCSENAQAVADAGIRLVAAAARHDVHQRAEEKK